MKLSELDSTQVTRAKQGASGPLKLSDLHPDDVQAVDDPNAPSKLESGIVGAGDTLSFGTAPNIVAGLKAAGSVAMGGTKLSDIGDKYDSELVNARENQKDAHETNPLSYTTGRVAGGGIMALSGAGLAEAGALDALPAAKALFTPASTLAGAATQGATIGAAQGFGEGEGGVGNRLQGAAQGAIVGGVGGAALHGVVQVGRGAFQRIAGYFDPIANQASALGMTGDALSEGGVSGAPALLSKANESGLFAPGQVQFDPESASFAALKTGGPLPSKMEIAQRLAEAVPVAKQGASALLEEASTRSPDLLIGTTDPHVSTALEMLDDQIAKLRRGGIGDEAPRVAEKLASFRDSVASRLGEGMGISDANVFKQDLQSQIRNLNGYGPDVQPPLVVNAMKSVAAGLRQSIEGAVDKSVPEAAGLLGRLNGVQQMASDLGPSLQSSIAADRIAGTNPISRQALTDSIPLLGTGTQAQLQRAQGGMFISRSYNGIMAQKDAILSKAAAMNPDLALQLQKVFSLPKTQLIPAIEPFLSAFSNKFEPSPYGSLFDNKISDPVDVLAHKQFITSSNMGTIQKARELSSLNKDGTVLTLPGQGQ